MTIKIISSILVVTEDLAMSYNWRYKYTQPYNTSKYNRLFEAQRIITVSNDLFELDKLEPVEDLTEANKYLSKFRLRKDNGN